MNNFWITKNNIKKFEKKNFLFILFPSTSHDHFNESIVNEYVMRHQESVRTIRKLELERLAINSTYKNKLPRVVIDPVTNEETFLVKTDQKPINEGFIFYNMMSRSGGLSMQNIGKMLSIDNEFSFLRMDSNLVHTIDDQVLVTMLNKTVHPPFLLMKHHFYFDFADYDHVLEPTYRVIF